MFLVLGQLALLVRHVEVAGPEIDVDLVGGGEIEQMRFGFLGNVEQRLGAFEAELGLQFLRAGTLAGSELAAVSARCAIAEAVRLDQGDAGSCLGRGRSGIGMSLFLSGFGGRICVPADYRFIPERLQERSGG